MGAFVSPSPHHLWATVSLMASLSFHDGDIYAFCDSWVIDYLFILEDLFHELTFDVLNPLSVAYYPGRSKIVSIMIFCVTGRYL